MNADFRRTLFWPVLQGLHGPGVLQDLPGNEVGRDEAVLLAESLESRQSMQVPESDAAVVLPLVVPLRVNGDDELHAACLSVPCEVASRFEPALSSEPKAPTGDPCTYAAPRPPRARSVRYVPVQSNRADSSPTLLLRSSSFRKGDQVPAVPKKSHRVFLPVGDHKGAARQGPEYRGDA